MVDIEAGAGGHLHHLHHHEAESGRRISAGGGTAEVGSSCHPESRRRSLVEDGHAKKAIVEDLHDHHQGLDSSSNHTRESHSGTVMTTTTTGNNDENVKRPPQHIRSVSMSERPAAPMSGRLPLVTVLANKAQKQQTSAEPKLLHPILSKVPLQFRFGVTGILSNILFMVAYNTAVQRIDKVQPSIIYAVVYFFFIPASHLMVSLLVFGWPERYLKSLMSNFPIGLTALAMGGVLTAYLDQAGFNQYVAAYVRDFFTFSTMPARDARVTHDEEGEFYSSFLVLLVTSLWTYVLSVYVNSPPAKSQKKEL